jgi:hypothetical protein
VKISDISITDHGAVKKDGGTQVDCSDLARFDTIIIDNNAYFARRELMLHNKCLLRYVRQGGNLIVLGQQSDDWSLVTSGAQFTPYPIKLSIDRLTIETSPVKIRDAETPPMAKPNNITSKDFEGWLVDRAVNVPREWSSEYTPLIESSDPGEEPNRGSLLLARYGDGTYIFASLALRRQLLNGNGGAYRVLANLVSLPKTAKAVKPQ